MTVVELKILQGELKDRVLTFTRPGCILFGRAADATLCVTNDPFVSRHHFLLEVSPPFVLLSDLGSKNGVFVNEMFYGGRDPRLGSNHQGPVPPKSVFLGDGDQIVIGQNRLTVAIFGGAPESPSSRKRTTGKRPLFFSGVQTAAMGDIPTETVFGNFEVGHEIGRGWLGTVYQAVDTRSGRLVSLKTLVPNIVFAVEAAETFLRNARGLQNFDHPSICRQYDLWREGNVFVCAQEYVDGMDLEKLLALRGGKLGLNEAVPIMHDVLDALVYAHSISLPGLSPTGTECGSAKGVLHRNLKPRNILVSGQGYGLRARVADFGLYHALESAGLTQMILSEHYFDAAPYWPRERITFFERSLAASEVFSAAAIFYEMLTGHLPREGVADLRNETRKAGRPAGLADFLGVFASHPPVPVRSRIPEIPAPLAEVIDRALAEPVIRRDQQKPEEILAAARYPDMATFREALAKACSEYGWTRENTGPNLAEGWEAPGEEIDAALIVVDLENSTHLVNQHGTKVFSSIVNDFNSLFRTHESKAGLRFLKCTGDGFFGIYRQTEDALQAAQAVIMEAARKEIKVRVAMNWGRITIASDGDFLGHEVHKVFRIEGLKDVDRVSGNTVPLPPHGRILATRAIADRAPGQFGNLGSFHLKGFENPCEVFLFHGS